MAIKKSVWDMILKLVIAVISAFIPFHKTLKVAVVKTGDDMV